MKKLLAVLIALTLPLCGIEPRSPGAPIYTVYKDTTLAGAAEVVTIRTPSSGSNKSAYMIDVDLYCSVACEVTIEMQGTYSTGTTITPVKGQSSKSASEILATSGTSISGTTVKTKKYLAAGETCPLDLIGIFLTEPADAITFRTNSITGQFTLTARFEQK
jgi:hypothetical protein